MEQAPQPDVLLEAPRLSPFPAFPALLRGLAGYTALGIGALISAEGIQAPLALSLSVLVAAGGAVVMTTPTLLVAHQYLGLSAKPGAVLGAVIASLSKTGGLALWLAPVLLFFAASGTVWATIYWIAVLWLGVVGLCGAVMGLSELEERWTSGATLALGWAVLSAATGTHLLLKMYRLAVEG